MVQSSCNCFKNHALHNQKSKPGPVMALRWFIADRFNVSPRNQFKCVERCASKSRPTLHSYCRLILKAPVHAHRKQPLITSNLHSNFCRCTPIQAVFVCSLYVGHFYPHTSYRVVALHSAIDPGAHYCFDSSIRNVEMIPRGVLPTWSFWYEVLSFGKLSTFWVTFTTPAHRLFGTSCGLLGCVFMCVLAYVFVWATFRSVGACM